MELCVTKHNKINQKEILLLFIFILEYFILSLSGLFEKI